jgi:hypothetical protein
MFDRHQTLSIQRQILDASADPKSQIEQITLALIQVPDDTTLSREIGENIYF